MKVNEFVSIKLEPALNGLIVSSRSDPNYPASECKLVFTSFEAMLIYLRETICGCNGVPVNPDDGD